jgi:hypothetical protein
MRATEAIDGVKPRVALAKRCVRTASVVFESASRSLGSADSHVASVQVGGKGVGRGEGILVSAGGMIGGQKCRLLTETA